MHQRRSVGAEFTLGSVQPQHGLALTFRDRLPSLPAIDIFPGGIDSQRSALGFLPIALECPPALVLRLVDLTMRVQPAQGIVAIERSVTILSPGSRPKGSSTATAATSALRSKSRDRRSCTFAG